MIKRFFGRNKPIFVMGTVFLLIFLGIIIYYKAKPHEETNMSKVGDESFYRVLEDEQKKYEETLSDGSNNQKNQNEQEEAVIPEVSVDEKFGILEIEYTDEGFKPRAIKTVQGRAVRWTNKTDKVIYLHQRKPTYDELKELVEIKPGESFNFRLSELGIWTYEENESKHFGSIEVVVLTD